MLLVINSPGVDTHIHRHVATDTDTHKHKHTHAHTDRHTYTDFLNKSNFSVNWPLASACLV